MDEFGKLTAALRPKMMAWAVSWLRDRDRAEDLVSDTVVRMLEQRDKFEAGTNISAWASTIMYNLMISQWRRSAKHASIPIDLMINQPSDLPEQDSGIAARELQVQLMRLPKEQRDPLVMHIVGGKTMKEIARTLGITEGTVKSRMCRGRDRLTLMLGYGVGVRSVDELRARAVAKGGDKEIVLRKRPTWFCEWNGKGIARVMGDGILIAESSSPSRVWILARKFLEGVAK